MYGTKISNKLVIGHLEKQLQEVDSSKKIKGIEMQSHPSVKIMIEKAKEQERRAHGGANFVIIFCGALVDESEELFKLGFGCEDIIKNYNAVLEKALAILQNLKLNRTDEEPIEHKEVASSLGQFGHEAGNFAFEEALKICRSFLGENESYEENKDTNYVSSCSKITTIDSCPNFAYEIKSFFENYKVKKFDFSTAEPDYQGPIITYDEICKIFVRPMTRIALFKCPIDYFHFGADNENVENIQNENEFYERLMNFDSKITCLMKHDITTVISLGKIDDFGSFFMQKRAMLGISIESKFDLIRLSNLTNTEVVCHNNAYSIVDLDLGCIFKSFKDSVADESVAVIQVQTKANPTIRSIAVKDVKNGANSTSKNLDKVKYF